MQLLTGPAFPQRLSYLFDFYAEFTLWHDWERAPTWADWQAFGALMQRPLSPFDLRALRQIHNAYARAADAQRKKE